MPKLTIEQREIATKYGHMFINTGGNDPIELMEREGVNYFSNPVVAEFQGSCYSQTVMLLKLQQLGMLVPSNVGKATGTAYCSPSAARTAITRYKGSEVFQIVPAGQIGNEDEPVKAVAEAPKKHGGARSKSGTQMPSGQKAVKTKYSEGQRAWCENFLARTGYPPMLADYEAGYESFVQAARNSVNWYEDHSKDAYLAICTIPGSCEEI